MEKVTVNYNIFFELANLFLQIHDEMIIKEIFKRENEPFETNSSRDDDYMYFNEYNYEQNQKMIVHCIRS